MIRAHLATFPPRAAILRRVVQAIRPQVDHLFIVLNGYDAVPEDLVSEGITAIIPDRDVKDAGKFWFDPAPDDIVFLIDDDLGYPPDYVARSIDEAAQIGWDRGAFGHLGFAWHSDRGARGPGWRLYKLAHEARKARGMDMLGTGATVLRGDRVPPLSAVEAFAGAADVALALWLRQRGHELWLLPHPADWLSNDLPDDLQDTSLHRTTSRRPTPQVRAALVQLIADAPANRDIPFHKYAPDAARPAIH